MDNGAAAHAEAQGRRTTNALSAGRSKGLQDGQKKKERQFGVAHSLSIAFLLLLFTIHGVGIYLFTNGFLLSRLVLEHKSQCSILPIGPGPGSKTKVTGSNLDGCWHPKSFNKAVIIIIDALRYDFTVPFQPGSPGEVPHHYHDSLKLLHETARDHPHNAILRPFIADAPTTTLQRLKGLTTGTLPTFIDAGSNFAGTEIDEDNLIAQLRSAGKTVVQLGDDTWQSLFPGLFDPDLTKPYDSFNVWDLFTVDNGVTEHLFPLLQPSNASKWDVVIGHYLGVDHAGHRYGPDHPAMSSKLQEMDALLRRVLQSIDHDTLLVVMGDHGMDVKGDHGGESDDEVEAALWMYSKRSIFGRPYGASAAPPLTAKERPVAQIDLVPTLALLLGLPIPFNNLGAPIDDAFLGKHGADYKNFALVNRLTAAQVHRYQQEYALVRKPDPASFYIPDVLWDAATRDWDRDMQSSSNLKLEQWKSLAYAFRSYQQHNLEVCRALWSRFNLVSIAAGIAITAIALVISFAYIRDWRMDSTTATLRLVVRGGSGLLTGGVLGFLVGYIFPEIGITRSSLFSAALACCIMLTSTLLPLLQGVPRLLPTSIWSWTCLIAVLLLSLGFGANSFTIWEDEILLFLLATFGVLMFSQSFRLKAAGDRAFACYHSIIFCVSIRLASLSRLCREEQMPHCRSTFYASAASSTSAPWQLAIPYLIATILPTTVKTYYDRTASYQGSAPFWIGIALRATLFLIAAFWTLDSAANAKWLDKYIAEDQFKTVRVSIAQLVLAIAAGAGVATFAWQSPLIGIEKLEAVTRQPSVANSSRTSPRSNGIAAEPTSPAPPKPQIMIHGTNNLYGSHFAVLPMAVLLIPLLLFQKPMGQGALALVSTAIFSLLELLHLLRQPRLFPSSNSSITQSAAIAPTPPHSVPPALGPTILALLAHFAFFKTGHQAALASIQWDANFVALRTIRYPWSPLFMILNTFAGQILCAAAVPCVVLWRRPYDFTVSAGKGRLTVTTPSIRPASPPESSDASATKPSDPSSPTKGTTPTAAAGSPHGSVLSDVSKAYVRHILVYAAINLATTVFAAHLRRHLMLYRVFSPRWIFGSVGMLVAEIFGLLVGVVGVRWTVGALSGLFGW